MATKNETQNVEKKVAAPVKKAAAPKAVSEEVKAMPKKASTSEKAEVATSTQNENLDLILELKNITKTFLGGKIVANDDVSLSFARNEVHAIVGENGSGKSTLMNIIFGLYKQDKGDIFLNGKKVDMYQSGAAKKYKIGMVHQHFHLVDAFTVLENVILGQEELTKSKKEKKQIKGLKQELKEIKKELRTLYKLDSMRIEHDTDKTLEISFEDQRLGLSNSKHDLEDELRQEEEKLAKLVEALKSEKEIHLAFKKDKSKAKNPESYDELMSILDNVHAAEALVIAKKEEVLILKEKINDLQTDINILEKENSSKKKKTSLKLKESDTNFIAGVLKLIHLRHDAQIEIEKQENIIKELKNERAKLSFSDKHDIKRSEQIQEEITDRKVVIKEEKAALELIENYEHGAVNADQNRAIELAERQYIVERDLALLDAKLTGHFGKIKKEDALKRLKEIQLKYNVHLDPYAKVETLAVGQRQMVEILKVLWEEKDIIVFDEPTATLSVVEIDALMLTIEALKAEGKTIIFISHKLKEVKALADRVSVLRKGVMMGTHDNTDALKPADIGKLMVGKTIELDYPARKIANKPLIKVENLTYKTHTGFRAVDNVSFEIHEGEIFGLAGIEGNGQEEIVKILTDLRKPYRGSISMSRETSKKETKQLMKERAQIEADRIIEEANRKEKELTVEFLERKIKANTKDEIRDAKLHALDLRSKVVALEGEKPGKAKLKEIEHGLKKDILLIKKNEHELIKELHSHKKAKELKAEIVEIHKLAKLKAKSVVAEVAARIKKKDIDERVWDVLTDSDKGYHLSGLERRKIQSHVPIDRLKHGVVPMKDLEFNARISDYDTHFFKHATKEEKAVLTDKNEIKFNTILREQQEHLEEFNAAIVTIEEQITALTAEKQTKEVKAKLSELNKKLNDYKSDIKILESGIKHNESRKKENYSKLMNPVYRFTEQIIEGMKVDGAFNHQVELRNLSGGNQQKFVVGREMYRDHKIFVAGHPTRGLDISAIDHIYKSMIKNSEGKATLLYSLEINELLAVCDRVAIMYHGKIMDIVNPKEVTLEEVSRMMIGEVK